MFEPAQSPGFFTPTPPLPRFPALRAAVRDLSPAYFAMVMATGIVSLSAHMTGMPRLAATLLGLNAATYLVIGLLTVLRVLWFRPLVGRDLVDHLRGPGFFTAVAGSCILGSQFVLILAGYRVALLLWALAIVLWVALTYTILTAFTIKQAGRDNRRVAARGGSHPGGGRIERFDGTPLAAALPPHNQFLCALDVALGRDALHLDDLSDLLSLHLLPVFPGRPVAALLDQHGRHGDLDTRRRPADHECSRRTLPFVPASLPEGFHPTGTWWIPMLAILAVWRYIYQRFPLEYDPLYWGAVFPLGMYAACTFQMARAMHLDFLLAIPRVFVYIALAAWLATFLGLCRVLAGRLVKVPKKPAGSTAR
jgi:tellurite resistance protein TehA-like permease